jgi:hypothetical protein
MAIDVRRDIQEPEGGGKDESQDHVCPVDTVGSDCPGAIRL